MRPGPRSSPRSSPASSLAPAPAPAIPRANGAKGASRSTGGSDVPPVVGDAPVGVDLPPPVDGSRGSGGGGGGGGATCVPGIEVCDGMDNDCDGERDEHLAEDCGTACGPGTRRCVNGQWDRQECPRAPADDDVLACGAPGGGSICQRCRTDTDGTAACRGGVCALDCNVGFIRCNGTPNFCVRPHWTFEGGAEDFSSEVGLQSANDTFNVSNTRAAEGSRALGIPVRFGDNNCERRNVRVQLRHCGLGGGSSNLAGKTLSFQVYLDGPALPTGGSSCGSAATTAASPPRPRHRRLVHRPAPVRRRRHPGDRHLLQSLDVAARAAAGQHLPDLARYNLPRRRPHPVTIRGRPAAGSRPGPAWSRAPAAAALSS